MTQKRKNVEDRPYKVSIYRELCSVEEFVGTYDENDDQYMMHKGMVSQKIPPEDLRIDPSLIPDHVRDDLSAATLDFVRRMTADPKIRENVAARKRAKKDMRQK